jgi:hypothetical protein
MLRDRWRRPRLPTIAPDADHDITVARDSAARQTHVGAGEVHELAAGSDTGARDVDEEAADLRRSSGDGGHFIDIVRACRSGIDPTGDPVLKGERRSFLAARGMSVDVDQAGSAIATSRTTEGSMTRPPLMIRS